MKDYKVKYTIVKEYEIVISADSENEAREEVIKTINWENDIPEVIKEFYEVEEIGESLKPCGCPYNGPEEHQEGCGLAV